MVVRQHSISSIHRGDYEIKHHSTIQTFFSLKECGALHYQVFPLEMCMSNPPSNAVANSQKIAEQPLSIQLISLKRTRAYLGMEKNQEPNVALKDLISRVVDEYNKSREKARSTGFERCTVKNLKELKDYKIKVYSRQNGGKTKLMNRMQKDGGKSIENNRNTEFLLFYLRDEPEEVFALTSGQAWEAVRKCVNYQFPTKIAERVLDCHKITKIVRRCLIGPNLKETIENPSGHTLYQTANLYHLIEAFECTAKKGSSLMGLRLFEEEPRVKISTGLMRVMRPLLLEHYPSMLSLFSQCFAGQVTYDPEGVQEVVDPQFEFLHFLQPAQIASKRLDQQLARHVLACYQAGKEQNFSFRDKNLQDYLSSTGFEILSANSSRYVQLPKRPPTLDEIVEYVADSDPEALKGEEPFLKALEGGKLRYNIQGGATSKPRSLIQCMEGEVRYAGQSYFKVRNMWYQLTADYDKLLYADYVALLKQTLIRPDHEAQLPLLWIGNKRQGYLTQSAVQEKLDIKAGIRAFMDRLKKTEVSYIEKNGSVNQKRLVGELLKNKLVLANESAINTVLQSGTFSEKAAVEHFGEGGKKIFGLLKEKRPILKDGKQKYVLNPFLYPLKKEPFLEGSKYEEFTLFLEEMCTISENVEDEEVYNRSYLYNAQDPKALPHGPETGFLVFDQILPKNIEPCDVIKYTKETVYLYAVKEKFGQSTREACSQIVNAAKEFRSALSMHHSDNYLEQMWKEAHPEKPKGWFETVVTQLDHLGKEAFLDIFYQRKIVFVYAFLESPGHSLHDEVKRPSAVSLDGLVLPDSTVNNEKLFQMLQKKGFLDERRRLTGTFFASSQKTFLLDGEYAPYSKEVYTLLKTFAPASESTIAKLELLRLQQELRSLNFELKICEIKQKDPGSAQSSLTTQSTELTSEFEELNEEDFVLESSPVSTSVTEIENGPVGLCNIGNSCYMSATLQILFKIPSVCELISDYEGDDDVIVALKEVLEEKDAVS